MKKICFCIIALLIIVLSGCSHEPDEYDFTVSFSVQSEIESTEKTKIIMEDTVLIDKEYLINNSELSEEDLDGIDVNGFIEYWEITEEKVKSCNMRTLLNSYIRDADHTVIDYSYLFNESTLTLSEDLINDITVVAWKCNMNNLMKTMILDFSEKKVFYGYGDFADDCSDNYVGKLTDEGIAEILNIVKNCNVTQWKQMYNGTSENTTGHFTWSVAFEISDKDTILYHGSGVLGDNSPDELDSFMNSLENIESDVDDLI